MFAVLLSHCHKLLIKEVLQQPEINVDEFLPHCRL